MSNRSSRHAQLGTYARAVRAVQEAVELHMPRLRKHVDAERSHRVVPGERLDLLAFRFYDDPHQFWKLADANPDRELDSLVSPGNTIKVPETS